MRGLYERFIGAIYMRSEEAGTRTVQERKLIALFFSDQQIFVI